VFRRELVGEDAQQGSNMIGYSALMPKGFLAEDPPGTEKLLTRVFAVIKRETPYQIKNIAA